MSKDCKKVFLESMTIMRRRLRGGSDRDSGRRRSIACRTISHYSTEHHITRPNLQAASRDEPLETETSSVDSLVMT